MIKYVDAHCHLADPRFQGKLEQILARSREAGIGAWVQGGVDPADWDRQLEIQRKYPGEIYTSFGLHPWWVARAGRVELDRALALLGERLKEANGLGELGLDYGPKLEAQVSQTALASHDPQFRRKWQREAFERQLELWVGTPKPLVLHVVRAHEDALKILKNRTGGQVFESGGLVHSFSGPREIARKYLDLGLSLSISGGIIGKGFETLKRAVSYIPLDRLLVETDSPDQALPGRNLNDPTSLIEIAHAIADLRSKSGKKVAGESAEQILEQSARNITRIFGGPK